MEATSEAVPRGLSGIRAALSHLEPQHWFLLHILGATSFFDGYDRGIIQLALPQIRHSFGLTQSSASLYLSILYLGALPALLITRKADQLGRRRLLVVSITGYTIATGLTALAPNTGAFVACQFAAKLFLNAEAALVWTMAAEELPAKVRGFGFGWLAMNSALGVGVGAIVFGGIFEPHGISWRWMYVLGLPPLLIVSLVRRRLPESRRFIAAQAQGHLAGRWHAIFKPPHRRWLVLVLVTAALTELTTQAGVFALDFLQTDRGVSSTMANFMLVLAGLPGIPIMVLAGSLSDRLGRRLVGCAFASLSVLGALVFFWAPGGEPVLLFGMSLTLVGQLGAWPVLSSYATELFPTSLRGQAGSWSTLARVGGQSASFAVGGALISVTGSFPAAATILALGPVVAVVIIAVAFPDTHGRELEDITMGSAPESAA
jgi:putative MFS transporter